MNCHEEGKPIVVRYYTYARTILKKIIVGIVVIALLQGCLGYTGAQKERENQPLALDVGNRMPVVPDKREHPLVLDVRSRMLMVHDEPGSDKQESGPLYRFRAKEMPIVRALDLFAHDNDLNIIASPDVTGTVTVDFKDLSLEESMEVILDVYGYYWLQEGPVIRVYKHETEIFVVDYVRLIRQGQGSSQASIASSVGSETGGITITQSDTINFWENLEIQLTKMISKEGKIIVNRLSGTIQVTDFHKKVGEIKNYIDSITSSIKRQVLINVKILDVLLNDQFSLGIDWNLALKDFDLLDTVNASNIIATSITGLIPATRTISLSGTTHRDFNYLINALKEQGELSIISKPSIRVMNNQPALIRVGTDRPFFTQTTTIGTGTTPNTVTEEVQYINEGLILSITPQISEDDKIMLDVTPVISRLAGTQVSTFGSTAPIMEIKQSSTVVELRDGEMVTIGGLIQNTDSDTTRKTPLLGDIPLLGNLFKGTFTTKRKSELVIFITPTIIKDI